MIPIDFHSTLTVLSNAPTQGHFRFMANAMGRFLGNDQEGMLANRNKSILERIYTNRILDEEGARILEEQDEVISRFELNRTGLMKESRRLRVRGISGNEQMGMVLSMVKYLRFQDIVGSKKTILGIEEATKKRRKEYHLYNRIVFGGYNRIMSRLMFGFTDDVKSEIKEQAMKAGLIKVEL